jgi:exonuclease III
LKLCLEDKKINLVNIYAPNLEAEQFEFINQMYNFLLPRKNLILAGDFNAVTRKCDRISKNEKTLKKYELEWIKLYKNFCLEEINYCSPLQAIDKMTWSNSEVGS